MRQLLQYSFHLLIFSTVINTTHINGNSGTQISHQHFTPLLRITIKTDYIK